MARALPLPLLLLSTLLACVSSPAATPARPAPVAPAPAPVADAERLAPEVDAAGGTSRLGWGFGADGLVPVPGGDASGLQTLDRAHTLQVHPLPFEFGANERDAIALFRQQRRERCEQPERIEVQGRRAFYARCRVGDQVEHGMALTTGRTLLLAVCTARQAERDECAAMLRTMWLPELSSERHPVALSRAARVGQRMTMVLRLTRTLLIMRTGPDHRTEEQQRRYEAELVLVGEVLELGPDSAPRKLRYTVQQADASVDGAAVTIAPGTEVLLDREARPQTRITTTGLPQLPSELLASALGATAYFPLEQARYGTSEPQPLDGTWAGPAEVRAAGGEAYSKLIGIRPCGDVGKCLEVETETFMPGLITLPFAEGTGSEAARILVRGLYPRDPAVQSPWFTLQLVQHSEGILTEKGRAYMLAANTRVRVEARLTWHRD
ncbi:MAG: hypothetical protein OXT09_28875 [Myxococcales bacterium]|nr:hypothetical protein [Myxococcales bacterium]